MELGGKVM